MQVDKTTLADLSIFHSDEEQSVFHHLNFTHTNDGRERLRHMLAHPHESLEAVENTQHAIRKLMNCVDSWPADKITNGTIMVIEKYFESQISSIPANPSGFDVFMYRLLNGPDYSLIRYTVEHTIDFLAGLQRIVLLLEDDGGSRELHTIREKIRLILHKPVLQVLLRENKKTVSKKNIIRYGAYLRHSFKNNSQELIDIYSRLDALLSIAVAAGKYDFQFPAIRMSPEPFVQASGLFHPLLQEPVSYDIHLSVEKNFLFLTGANMGGKSTFIKAVGVSVYLAHLGFPVPAAGMEMSYLDGLLSNIQVVDNIIRGESFFFNEVQRIRNTIEKISDGKHWLILIDELFKGTNQQDAVRCSTTVIEGFRKMRNALFVLSTHLYEIGDALRKHENIQFRYFETSIVDDQLIFSYQLKEGISNDRLGYLILKKEGVVDLLEKL
jgi:DNA mismatch repair protein MutS